MGAELSMLLEGITESPYTIPKTSPEQKAVCILSGQDVKGIIYFTQKEHEPMQITGKVEGLTEGLHGFHIHEFGDITSGCTSAGPHFNPDGSSHGAQTDPQGKRHVGDLGNIEAGFNGIAYVNITDNIMKLFGTQGILGRCLVVHDGEDDLGKGGHPMSLTTGNSGGRVACGVIGYAQDY